MRLAMASRIQAREELTVFSWAARSRRYSIGHAKVRSTTRRRGRTSKVFRPRSSGIAFERGTTPCARFPRR